MTHLLVTNDFPPKVGGIQSYLWELWRRLPPDSFAVLTTGHPDAATWDADQPFRIERVDQPMLLPVPGTVTRIDDLAAELDADIVLLDPAWPLGALGPSLARPYGVVLHGAEVTVPARLPFVQLALRRTLRQARLVVAAGGYPAAEGRRAAGRDVPTVVVPPGVDVDRFHPVGPDVRAVTRERFGLDPAAPLVLSVSRLVPRKGIDVVLQAVSQLVDRHPGLHLAVAGDGRDRERLERLAGLVGAPTQFLGRVPDADLPALYACADVFAMVCRDRWFGLEQEGYGIVFLEAAACGVPAVAGRSGGSAEAVVDGQTGVVVDQPTDVAEVASSLELLLGDPSTASAMGLAGRRRVERELTYDSLADVLQSALEHLAPQPAEPR